MINFGVLGGTHLKKFGLHSDGIQDGGWRVVGGRDVQGMGCLGSWEALT